MPKRCSKYSLKRLCRRGVSRREIISGVIIVAICIGWSMGGCDDGDKRTGAKPSLSEAQTYLGLRESDLHSKLGRPMDVDEGNSPDGPFRILHYSKEKDNETYFVIFKDDGIVQSGYYKGVMFHDKQKR